MKTKKTILKNGLRIVTVPMEAPTVTVLVMVEAGTKYENKKTNGLSHFLEHMCFKGTATRTTRDIAYQIETMGAETNAFTWYDYTGYYIKGKAQLMSQFLDIVSDVYLHSTFPEAEIEKERGVICGEIDMYEDMPHRKVQELLGTSLYGEQSAGMPILGPKENILAFTQKDFRAYHKKHYVSGATTVVVVGGITHTDVVKEVKKCFKMIPVGTPVKKPAIKKTTGDKVVTHNKKTDQSHIALGVRLPHALHPDMPALVITTALLGNGMGSRLFIRLREEMGSGYYVRAGLNRSNDISEMVISTGTEPKRVGEVTQAIYEEIAKISTEEIPESDIARAKEYVIGNMYMRYEATDDIAMTLGDTEILHIPHKTLSAIEKELRAVTVSDIVRIAKKYLRKEAFHYAIIGPHQ
jgi:predicted Zn-dependent peptidase